MKIVQNILDRIRNYPKHIAKGNLAFNEQKLDEASKSYQKVIKKLEQRSRLDAFNKQYLGEAYLGMGNICAEKKETSDAFNYYILALDTSILLSNMFDNAIVLLGNLFCEKKEKNERAIEIYLRYITIKPQDIITDKIYSILESMCFVDEKQNPDERQKAISLNQRIISVNQHIEWSHYYLGVGLYLENDKTKAQKYLLNAIKLNSERALSFYWNGKIYSKLDQIEQAENNFLKFIELIPDNDELLKQAEILFYLGMFLINSIGGFFDILDPSVEANQICLEKAAIYLQKASLKNKQDDQILIALARTFSLLNLHRDSINAFKKAIGINNEKSEYYYLLAIDLMKLEKYQDAIDNVLSAIQIEDKDGYHHLLGELYFLAENFSSAEHECLKIYGKNYVHDSEVLSLLIYALFHQNKYENLIDICEKYNKKLLFNKKYPDVCYYIARSYSKTDKFTNAIKWYIKVIEINERADAIYYLGCALSNKGDFEKALTVFKRIIGKGTEYQALAYLQRGLIYFKLEQIQNAEEDFLKAYTLEKKNNNILYSIGLFYYLMGDIQRASKYLSDLLTIQSDHISAVFIQGHIHEKNGMIEAAKKEYESILDNSVFNKDCCIRLGIIYFNKGDIKKAFTFLQQAYQSDDQNDALLFYHGLISALDNNFALALQSWNKLSDRYPKDERLKANIHRIHYLFGCSYIREQKYAEAIQEWKEYLKVYNEDEITKKHLASLYFRLFVVAIKSRDIERAKELVMNASELDKGNKKYIFYAALCDYKMGLFDQCIEQLDNIIDSELEVQRIKYHKAVGFLRKGAKSQAMHIFDDLINGNIDDNYISYSKWIIANEYIANGKYDDAITILDKLIC